MAKHRLSYEPFNLAPPPPKLILSIIRWFLALDCLPANSKTKLKLCYASFRDMRQHQPAKVAFLPELCAELCVAQKLDCTICVWVCVCVYIYIYIYIYIYREREYYYSYD